MPARQGVTSPDALHDLGVQHCLEGNYAGAIAYLRRARSLRPAKAEWRNNLAVALAAAAKWKEARAEFKAALALDPSNLDILLNFADTLVRSGLPEQGLQWHRQAVSLAPLSAAAHRALGENLTALGFMSEALCSLQEALRLDSVDPATYSALGNLYVRVLDTGQDVDCRQRVTELCPDQALAWANLAAAYRGTGEIEKAVDSFERALALDPGMTAVHSVYLNTLLHDARPSPAKIAGAHREWGRRVEARIAPRARSPLSKRPKVRLRVGYVTSGNFSPAECHFRAPILRNHDAGCVITFGYCGDPRKDESGREFRTSVHHWRNVRGLSPDAAAAQIRKDRIDVLVDLSGHLPSRLLPVFALRAAPVQVSFPAHPATSGLREMDYFITDEWTTPRGLCESHFTERLYRMPSGHLPYAPPDLDMPVTPLPALRNGFVTFAVLQRPMKMNSCFWDTAAAILRRVKGSRLLIHHSTRDYDHPEGRARLRIVEALAERGVDEQRLIFRGRLEIREHLALLAEVDIALDTWPYNGQTTTCECLWMGIPVVALSGDSYVSRVSRGILLRVGLEDWVADSERDYTGIAVRKARALPALASLRTQLRQKIEASTLFQYRLLASELEDGYQKMWRRRVTRAGRN
jgi:predicted O-linked N-acetylglucosamine transferase (SPINDLY family)